MEPRRHRRPRLDLYPFSLERSKARQIAIVKVTPNSPAGGVLKVGDVILGVGNVPFSYDSRVELGKALTEAESDVRKGKLTLLCTREGITEELIVNLPIIRKEVNWAKDFQNDNMATWYYGYVIVLLAEYTMATGDDSPMPGLQRLCLEAAKGQSKVGSWGHKFATPDGRLMGYGMMNATGVPLTIALAMGRVAGVKDSKLAEAIERSAKLLRFYIAKKRGPLRRSPPMDPKTRRQCQMRHGRSALQPAQG